MSLAYIGYLLEFNYAGRLCLVQALHMKEPLRDCGSYTMPMWSLPVYYLHQKLFYGYAAIHSLSSLLSTSPVSALLCQEISLKSRHIFKQAVKTLLDQG